MLLLLTSPKFNCHQRAQLCKMSWIFAVNIHLCPGFSWGRVNSQNLEGGTTKNSWPEISKGTFRTIWRHAQYIDWGSYWRWRRGVAAWECADYCVQVLGNCITCFIYSLCCYLFSLCRSLKLTLTQPMSFYLFLLIPGDGEEWSSSCCFNADWA